MEETATQRGELADSPRSIGKHPQQHRPFPLAVAQNPVKVFRVLPLDDSAMQAMLRLGAKASKNLLREALFRVLPVLEAIVKVLKVPPERSEELPI